MLKLAGIVIVIIGLGCSININLNFDPEKLEKAMDSFLDDIGYGKKDKKLPALRLFSMIELLYDIVALNSMKGEEESELEKIKSELKKNHKALEKYYDAHIIGESLDGMIKIVNSKRIKDEGELNKLKKIIKEQNELRNKFYRAFARENGKESEKAVEQVKEAFIKKTIERAKENKWCVEEKDESDNIKWRCPAEEE